jgi:hypothetical protein
VSLVDSAPSERFDVIDRIPPAPTARVAPSARQVISEAFDVIDRNEVPSSSPHVADDPTKVDQDSHASFFQRIWSAGRGIVTTFSAADRKFLYPN